MIGDDALVPPNTIQPEPPADDSGPKTATPVFGSATADTSAVALFAQPVPDCQLLLFVGYFEHPEPAPLQAVSLQPRPPVADLRVVPPTAMTPGNAAGTCTP